MAGSIGKAIGFPGMDDMSGGDDSSDESDSGPKSEKTEGSGSAEVLAMKQFMRATTPDAKASALKDFLEACGCSMSGGESY